MTNICKNRKGFITIATGDIRYSQLAYNLLLSYRNSVENLYPFAVITDSINEYTKEFDEIIMIESGKPSFIDKLLILKKCTFDETIFIDADSLVYGNLNNLFERFSEASIISCPGKCYDLNSIQGWFRYEDIGKYKELVEYTIWLHGGIYYIRQDPCLEAFYHTCEEIRKNYKLYYHRFKYLTEPADEPIIALAMAIHKFKPVDDTPDMYAFYRDIQLKKINIVHKRLEYIKKSTYVTTGVLIHWATENTKKALYRREVRNLYVILSDRILLKKKILIGINYIRFIMEDMQETISRLWKRLWKVRKVSGDS